MMEDRAGASGTADVDEYQVQRVLVPGVRMRNSRMRECTHLVHLEQPRVHLRPVLHSGCDRIQLRGVLMEWAGLDFQYPHDRHEI